MKVKKFLIIVSGVFLIGLMVREAHSVPPQPMDLIITPTNEDVCGHDYTNASATIQVKEKPALGTTMVTIQVRKAKPNHLHTVWIKLVASSPITGIGATPAAPTSEIDNIAELDDMAVTGVNGFYTNAAGNGTLHVNLDFLSVIASTPSASTIRRTLTPF